MASHKTTSPIPLPVAALHLLTLSSFAIAQPLLDLISKQVQFLVAHKLTSWETFLLGAFLILLFPLPLLLLTGLSRSFGARVYRWTHGLLVTLCWQELSCFRA